MNLIEHRDGVEFHSRDNGAAFIRDASPQVTLQMAEQIARVGSIEDPTLADDDVVAFNRLVAPRGHRYVERSSGCHTSRKHHHGRQQSGHRRASTTSSQAHRGHPH